jgi:hypothetical protein
MFNRITSTAQDGNNGDGGFIAVAPSVNGQRVQSVEQILNLLEAMPAADPPADLAVRTLQHIARRTGVNAMPAGAMAPTLIDPSQPTA